MFAEKVNENRKAFQKCWHIMHKIKAAKTYEYNEMSKTNYRLCPVESLRLSLSSVQKYFFANLFYGLELKHKSRF